MFRSKNPLAILFASIALCLLTMSICALNSPNAFAASSQSTYCTSSHSSGFGITVKPSQVNPNGTVTVTGQCFTPNGSVSISTSNLAPFTITADERGNITATFAAPAIPGIYTVTALDTLSGLYASTTYKVYGTVSHPSLSVSPNTVNPVTNASFSVNGKGFTPDTVVTLSATGNVTLTPATVTTDAYGNFGTSVTASFTIPGKYTITAIDGSTGAATSTTLTVR